MPLDKEEIEYYEHIIDTLLDNIIMLESELSIYKGQKTIVKIINFNLRNRRSQLRYYQNLLFAYKKLV